MCAIFCVWLNKLDLREQHPKNRIPIEKTHRDHDEMIEVAQVVIKILNVILYFRGYFNLFIIFILKVKVGNFI